MSTPEPIIKVKRKYTRRAKLETIKPAETPIPAQPSEIPEHTCTVPIASHLGEAMNGDKIMIKEFCQNAAAWVPTVHFEGSRMDPDPTNPKRLIPSPTHVASRFGPVCEMHKEKIQANISVLADGRQLESLSGEYYRQGFGDPQKTKTRITWAEFEPPTDNYESQHTQALNAK